jgi:hypothetical protein
MTITDRMRPKSDLHDVWPSVAITVIWLAVAVDALFGPDIETSNGAGTNTSSVPSAVALALFAFLTSWAIARYAFRREGT